MIYNPERIDCQTSLCVCSVASCEGGHLFTCTWNKTDVKGVRENKDGNFMVPIFFEFTFKHKTAFKSLDMDKDGFKDMFLWLGHRAKIRKKERTKNLHQDNFLENWVFDDMTLFIESKII